VKRIQVHWASFEQPLGDCQFAGFGRHFRQDPE
jgi:hypothetical protein